jgi:hypothetical protein
MWKKLIEWTSLFLIIGIFILAVFLKRTLPILSGFLVLLFFILLPLWMMDGSIIGAIKEIINYKDSPKDHFE